MSQRWLLLAALASSAGCVHEQIRSQSPDEKDPTAEVRTIGSITTVANAEAIAVSGVGLVVGLDGTGGPAPSSGFRTMLEDQLKKKGVENVKDVLNSPDHAMVLVSALIPAGCRKGDKIDVEVTLPPQSKATSLRGGRLLECVLFNYDSTKRLSSGTDRPDRPDRLVTGHPLVKAEGMLLGRLDGKSEDGSSDERPTAVAAVKVARVWGGGTVQIDRPFYLMISPDDNGGWQKARVAMRIAERINETFNGPRHGQNVLANAKTKEVVALGVPPQYRHNQARYLRVVRMIPLDAAPAPDSLYRRKLVENLIDPAKTVTAALRLEALGPDSISALKPALASGYPLVRFCAAEALAYLGQPGCGEELAKLIEEHDILRAHGLTALASLDEAVCHVKLAELMAHRDTEVRYGAFRALLTLDDSDPAIGGTLINDSFWLHQVASGSAPYVHLMTGIRPEVVIYGDGVKLLPPFSFLAGPEFTVTASKDDQRVTISRFAVRGGAQRRQCGFDLAEILENLGELGATYPDVVDLLRQADRCSSLSCKLGVDALPQATDVYALAKAGIENPKLLKMDESLTRAASELGETPELFMRPEGSRPRSDDDEDAATLRRRPSAADTPTASATRK